MVEKVLKAEPKAYKNIDQLITLAANLQSEENTHRNDLEFEIQNLAAEAAFQVNYQLGNFFARTVRKSFHFL